MHPQHILGVPHGAHALGLPCWSSCLRFQLLLVEPPGLPTQTATFLLAELPSAWAPGTGESKPVPAPLRSCPCATSLPGTGTEQTPTPLHCHSLGSLSGILSPPPPLQKNTTGSPGQYQVRILAIIYRFAIVRELCPSKLFIKGIPPK